MMKVRGKFITLEGGEGAGKSTQVKRLAQNLRNLGYTVLETREVGGCEAAEEIRELWLSKKDGYWDSLTEVALIMAARREHLVKTILPALESGTWVISDRFLDSTRAYQGIGLKIGLDVVDCFYRLIANDFLPDLTFVLDLPIDISLSRVNRRGGVDDRYEQKNSIFHNMLREAYLSLVKDNPSRMKIIDANASVDIVENRIQTILNDFIKTAD